MVRTVKEAKRKLLPSIGWREWVALPELGVSAVKAKIDTGAATSALHVFRVHEFLRDGERRVAFEIHPRQRSAVGAVHTEAPLLEYRNVKSSGGHVTRRPVIETTIELLGTRWSIELTLASRDAMGFRMLLGRQALRKRFVVDAGRSFVGGKGSGIRD